MNLKLVSFFAFVTLSLAGCLETTSVPIDSPDAGPCGGCPDPTRRYCNGPTKQCVACVYDDHCPASAPMCVNNVCAASCTADADCARFDTTKQCSQGRCVQCTAATEATVCGGKSCSVKTGLCTNTTLATVGQCRACEADSECLPNHRCIPMQYKGADRGKAFCLKQPSAGCQQPFLIPVKRPSLSGAAAEAYCGIVETLTTCEAVLDTLSTKSCTTAADCGDPSLADDGVCATINLSPNLVCTYSCAMGFNDQCPNSLTCPVDYCRY